MRRFAPLPRFIFLLIPALALLTISALVIANARRHDDFSKKHEAMNANSLFIIVPYKYHGAWVFDDPTVGLEREPFVAGIDVMIDKLVANIPNAEHGFRAIFSASAFPGATTKLEFRRGDSGGSWYYSDQFKMEGWLCPALFRYFPSAPKEIYVKAEPTR